MFRPGLAIACIAVLCASGGARSETDRISGPVAASLIRVVDGDTVLVSASPWPQQFITTYVRLRGINAPEMKARCGSEREAAETARKALETLLMARHLQLEDISGDKYFGRVVARIRLDDGRDASGEMMAEGLAEAYDGGRKAQRRCS